MHIDAFSLFCFILHLLFQVTLLLYLQDSESGHDGSKHTTHAHGESSRTISGLSWLR